MFSPPAVPPKGYGSDPSEPKTLCSLLGAGGLRLKLCELSDFGRTLDGLLPGRGA